VIQSVSEIKGNLLCLFYYQNSCQCSPIPWIFTTPLVIRFVVCKKKAQPQETGRSGVHTPVGRIHWLPLPMLSQIPRMQYSPPTDIPAADAIVVLGGGTEPAIPPRRSVEINSAGDRVFAAAQLYRDGKAPVLILSGGNIDWLSSTGLNASRPDGRTAFFHGYSFLCLILENTSQILMKMCSIPKP
jgi:hypothetical protein